MLQFFRIMDEMWMVNNQNMEMNRYKVMETGWKVGFIEFVDESEVITSMHKWRGWLSGSFNDRTMYEYFKWQVYPKIFKQNYAALKKESGTSRRGVATSAAFHRSQAPVKDGKANALDEED